MSYTPFSPTWKSFLIAAVIIIYIQSSAHAATKTWNGSTSVDWNNAANWTGGTPVGGDDVVLTGAGTFRPTNQNIAGLSLLTLSFNSTATVAFTVTGNGIMLTGTGSTLVVDTAAANHTLSIDITMAASQSWDIGTNRILVVGGVVSGGFALTKIGAGNLTLTATNSYTGGTTVSVGTFQLGNNTATGTVPGNILNNATITFAYSAANTYSGVISGTGGVNKNNAGVLTFTAANVYTGGTTVNGGTLRLSGDSASIANSSALTLNNAASTFDVDATATQNVDRIFNLATVTVNGGTILSLSAGANVNVTEQVGQINVTGAGAEIRLLSNSNTPGVGDAKLISTFLNVTGTLLFTRTASGSVTTEFGNLISSATTPGAQLNNVTVADVFGVAAPVYGIGLYSATEGVVRDAVTFTSVATGDWNTATTWTPSGIPGAGDVVVILTNHVISVNAASAARGVVFLATPAGNGTISGTNTLSLGDKGIIVSQVNTPAPTISCALSIPGPITVFHNNNFTLSGNISGAGGITKTGAGILSLSTAAGTNTFSGGFVLDGGEVTVNSSTALGTGTVTTTANSVRVNLTNTGLSIANNFVINGGNPVAGRGIIDGNAVTGVNNVTVSGTITINGTNASGGHLRGPAGTGTMFITNAVNALPGITIVHRDGIISYAGGGSYSGLSVTGTAVVGANNGIATNAVITLGAIATTTLNVNNLNQACAGLVLGGAGLSTVNTGTGTLTVNGDVITSGNFVHVINGNLNLGGAARTFNIADSTATPDLTVNAIVSNGGITKIGAGLMALSANNSYAGTTTVNAGTLRLVGDTAQIDESASILIQSGGTLEINNAGTANVDRIGNSVPVTLNSGTFSMTAPSNTLRTESFGILTRSGSGNSIVVTASGTGDAILTASSFAGTAPTEFYRQNDTVAASELGNLISTAATPNVTGFSVYHRIATGTPTYFANASYDTVQGVIGAGAAGTVFISAATGTWNVPATWVQNSGFPGVNDIAQISSNHVITLDASRSVSGVIFDATAAGNGSIAAANTLTVGAQGITVNAVNNPSPTINCAIVLGAATPVTVNSTGNLTLAGAISGAGGVVKNGPGTATLSVANTNTGATTINGGVLAIAADDRLGTAPVAATAGSIVINGGTFRAALTANQTLNANRGIAIGPVTGTGTGIIDVTGSTLSYAGIIANNGGTGTLTKSGAGTLTLTGVNTYSGGTIITGGTLSINDDARLGTVPGTATPGHLVINNGSLQITAAITLNANRGIAIGGTSGTVTGTIDATTGTATYGGIIANNLGGDGRLQKSGGGTLVLTGANTYTGGTTFTAGILSVASIGNINVNGNLGRGPLFFNTGTLQYTGASASTDRIVTMTNHGRVLVASPIVLTFAGAFVGAGAVHKDGTGDVILSGNNVALTSNVLVQAGRLIAAHANALGTGPQAATTVFSGATLGVQGGIVLASENILLNGSGTAAAGALVNISGNNTLTGTIELAGASSIQSASAGETLTISSNINAHYPLTVGGAGNVALSGIVSGATGFVPGLMEVRYPGAFDITTPAIGGFLRSTLLGRPPETNVKLNGGPWGDNETWVYTGQVYDSDGIFSFAESIDDSVQVKVNGIERLRNGNFDRVTNTATTDGLQTNNTTQANSNTFGTTNNFGTAGWYDIEIRVGNGGGGAGSTVFVAQNWIATKGFGFSAAGVNTFNATSYAIPTTTGDLSSVDGNWRVIASNSLTKTGSGSLILSNSNLYQGPTVISAGTLVVSNTTGSATGSGAVSIAAGATLEGTGIIAGAVVSDGAVSPAGASAGTLTLGSNFSLGASGSFVIQIDGAATSDQLVVGGNVALNAASSLVATAANTVHGTSITVLNNTGVSAITGNFNGLLDSAPFALGARPFTIRYTLGAGNNDIILIDDTLPAFSASSQTIDEGLGLAALAATDADTEALTFSITSGTLPAGITLNADGTLTGTATFTSQGMYALVIRVTDAVNGFTEAMLTITVIDVGFSVFDASVNETAGTVTISVIRSGTGTLAASVQADTVANTATASVDYTTTSIVLNWLAGENGIKTFTVPILDDTLIDFGETFNVVLSNPVNALLSDPTGLVLIIDDEATPVAVPDAVSAGQGKPLPISVLTNDVGLGNTPLSVSIAVSAINGTIVVNADNTVTYTSNAGFTGLDTFTYRVTDSQGQSSNAVVTVTVKPPPSITSVPTIQPNPVFVGSPVQGFAASDTGVITWNWGDGTASVGTMVTHTYSAPGYYQVVINIVSPEGLVVTITQFLFVSLGYDGPGGNGSGGGAVPPGVTGILVGGSGAGPLQGGSGKIVCNYIRREKTTYMGSLGKLTIPAALTQDTLANQPSTLTIGGGANMATFRFDLGKSGKGKATGLPLVEFSIKKKRFKFKAQRSDLTGLTEAIGGPQEFEFNSKGMPVTLFVPVSLQVGDKVFLAMTFQVTYKQISNSGKGGLAK